MLEEAIKLIEKQINMYEIQEQNIQTKARKKEMENKLKKALRKEIVLRNFILKILKDKKNENLENKIKKE